MDSLVLDLTQFPETKKNELKSSQILSKPKPGNISFEEMLSSSVKQVNTLQLEADDLVNRLAIGDVDDISEVALASSRAEIALRMFMELRNKFVDAYQQLSRMSG